MTIQEVGLSKIPNEKLDEHVKIYAGLFKKSQTLQLQCNILFLGCLTVK